jgi:hypothetical protein
MPWYVPVNAKNKGEVPLNAPIGGIRPTINQETFGWLRRPPHCVIKMFCCLQLNRRISLPVGMVRTVLGCLTLLLLLDARSVRGESPLWRKHVILSVKKCYNVAVADITGDGKPDIIANRFNTTMLLIAPNWKLVEIENERRLHVYASGVMDVDGDGDLDYVAAKYSPGLLFWLECPDKPDSQKWPFHVIDDEPDGVHGILLRDLDGDGRLDLVTNSAHSKGPLPQSLLWYKIPDNSRARWTRHLLGNRDAPGRPHYFTSGDFNGDGRVDIAVASSGVSLVGGDWLAWWEAPRKRTDPWTKHLIADHQVGATHVLAGDFNGDNESDFIASMGHGRGVVWFEATHWHRRTILASIREPHCLIAADLDGDGDLDAATISRKDFLAVWFENNGRGKFTVRNIARNQSAYDLCAADMDGDGDFDLIAAGAESDNVVWLENPIR